MGIRHPARGFPDHDDLPVPAVGLRHLPVLPGDRPAQQVAPRPGGGRPEDRCGVGPVGGGVGGRLARGVCGEAAPAGHGLEGPRLEARKGRVKTGWEEKPSPSIRQTLDI